EKGGTGVAGQGSQASYASRAEVELDHIRQYRSHRWAGRVQTNVGPSRGSLKHAAPVRTLRLAPGHTVLAGHPSRIIPIAQTADRPEWTVGGQRGQILGQHGQRNAIGDAVVQVQ